MPLSQKKMEPVGVIVLDTLTEEFTIHVETSLDLPIAPLTKDTRCSECKELLLLPSDRLIGCPDACSHWIHITCIQNQTSKDDEFSCRECQGTPSLLCLMPRFVVVDKEKT